jgi:hypothetical protein
MTVSQITNVIRAYLYRCNLEAAWNQKTLGFVYKR